MSAVVAMIFYVFACLFFIALACNRFIAGCKSSNSNVKTKIKKLPCPPKATDRTQVG